MVYTNFIDFGSKDIIDIIFNPGAEKDPSIVTSIRYLQKTGQEPSPFNLLDLVKSVNDDEGKSGR